MTIKTTYYSDKTGEHYDNFIDCFESEMNYLKEEKAKKAKEKDDAARKEAVAALDAAAKAKREACVRYYDELSRFTKKYPDDPYLDKLLSYEIEELAEAIGAVDKD